jgi:DNA-binding winged helix-turn-helix (wHTH) protein
LCGLIPEALLNLVNRGFKQGMAGYDWGDCNVNEQILYLLAAGQRERIQIRDKVRVCLNYMVGKNQQEGQQTLCTKQELIDAIWSPAENHGTYGDESLYGLIRDIRQVLEQTKTSHQWLETVKNLGYVLRIESEGGMEKS